MDKENEIKNVVVDTYAEDIAKVIADDTSGLVKKIIHGEEEHEKEKRNLSPESAKNRFFMVLGFIFMVFGFVILFFFFTKTQAPTVPVEKQFTPLIFNDSSTSIETSGWNKDKIFQAVFNAVKEADVKEGRVEGIYLIHDKKNVGLREFITLIKGNFVAGDNISIINDNFLLGAVNKGEKDFFMLIKMRSLADIFGPMRDWENKMFVDLSGFFGVENSAQTNYLFTKNFEDGVIENKNARILHDQDGKIAMMYIFADDNSVVITNTIPAAREIMLRLAAARVKK